MCLEPLIIVLTVCQHYHYQGNQLTALRKFLYLFKQKNYLTASQIAKESLKDQQLLAVMKSVQQGHWPVT